MVFEDFFKPYGYDAFEDTYDYINEFKTAQSCANQRSCECFTQ